jgi:hypothetical protein
MEEHGLAEYFTTEYSPQNDKAFHKGGLVSSSRAKESRGLD